MLVSVRQRPMDPTMQAILQAIGGMSNPTPREIIKGVYEIEHFSFDHAMGIRWEEFDDNYPKLTDAHGEWFGCYGVCDNFEQVLTQCPEIIESKTPYALSVTPIRKAESSPEGGWRWHKWGAYIGTQEPTTEYIYDEPVIEQVYCYHVHKIPDDMVRR
jgi:hypothetical protein